MLLTRKEVAARLKISISTLDRMIAAGDLPPSIMIGKRKRWRVDVIDRWIATK